MSKTKTTQAASQPDYTSTLLADGTVTIVAGSREEIAEVINRITPDVRYSAGAVSRNKETGDFNIRLDLVTI